MNQNEMNTSPEDAKKFIETTFGFLVQDRGYIKRDWQETNFNWILEYDGAELTIEILIDIRDTFLFILLSDPNDTAVPIETKYLKGKKKYLQDALLKLKLISEIGDKELQRLGGKWENIKLITEKLGAILSSNISALENGKAAIF